MAKFSTGVGGRGSQNAVIPPPYEGPRVGMSSEQRCPTGRVAGVTVVIVNWNGGSYLVRVLDALRHQTWAPARVVVMDNGSTDGSTEIVAQAFPEVRLRRLARNRGFAVANNLALHEEVNTEWVALLNPDAVPAPDWMESMWRGVEEHPGYSAYGCRMLCFDDPDRLDGTGDCYHPCGWGWRRDYGVPQGNGHLEAGEIFAPCAAAALYRCQDVREVGGFDEDFYCYFEDVDLGFRLRLAGRRCFYLPSAIVHHVGSAATGYRSDFAVYYGYRNLIWCWWKNMPTVALWRYLPGHVGLMFALVIAAWRRGQVQVAWKAWRDAMVGLPEVLSSRRQVIRHAGIDVTETMTRSWWRLYQAWRTRQREGCQN